MRTPTNDENSISGQMARRGIRPQYTLDRMPGQIDEPSNRAMVRSGGKMFQGGMGFIDPEALAMIQERMRQAYSDQSLSGEMGYGNDIFAGGMGPNGGPNPRRLARKARKLEKRKMRQDRLGGVKPKPAIGMNDGNDIEPDSDMDDVGSGPSYGDGKPSMRSTEGRLDPNQGYRDRFAEMANKPKPAMEGGMGGGPQDRKAVLAYLKQLGMK